MKTKLFLTIIAILILSTFVVSAATVSMQLDKESYTLGEAVTATFEDATGDKDAWFAIYPQGESAYQDYTANEKVWSYANTGTETAGTEAKASGSITFNTEGLSAGTYRLTYFPNISYDVGDSITFEIAEESTNPPTSDSFFLIPIAFISMVALVLLKRKEILL